VIWLAVVALLVDALLPVSLEAARGSDPLAAGRLFCGTLPGPSAPAKHNPAAPHHCVLCLAAISGMPPRHAPALFVPHFAGIAPAEIAPAATAARPSFLASVQPRGPPRPA
jgi:hypothetical protein